MLRSLFPEQRKQNARRSIAARLSQRLVTWLRRYLPAELVCTPAALLGAWIVATHTGNGIAIALAATWCEVVAFYAVMVARDLRALAVSGLTPRTLLVVMRNCILEFGPAELLDSLLIRPLAMQSAMAMLPDRMLGIMAGKLFADIFFYVPTIVAYELRTRLLEPRHVSTATPSPMSPVAGEGRALRGHSGGGGS